jgi:hypothetical protein
MSAVSIITSWYAGWSNQAPGIYDKRAPSGNAYRRVLATPLLKMLISYRQLITWYVGTE